MSFARLTSSGLVEPSTFILSTGVPRRAPFFLAIFIPPEVLDTRL
jgi:hypothetical protein